MKVTDVYSSEGPSPTRSPGRPMKYPWDRLAVNDCFCMGKDSYEIRRNTRGSKNYWEKKLGRKFVYRVEQIEGENMVWVYRVE